jgi:hypothetical protein
MNPKIKVTEFKNEEMTKAEYELCKVLDKYDEVLKEKLLEFITNSYFNAMMEVDRRKLPERPKIDRPRIDHFLGSMFYFIFSKMHKGNRLRAFEILEELKLKVLNM